MKISTKDWKNYISKLHRLSDQAANELQVYISKNGFANTNEIIDLAYALISKYGEGSAELACQMYEATAALEGVKILPAEPAPTATYEETAKAINGSLLQSPSGKKLTQVVQRHVKQAAADTTLKNAIRDKAMWAWIPSGDTCAFCLTLSSRGWQKASKATLKGNHAEHIHANCDCNFCVRFGNNLSVEGYDPDALREMYDNAKGNRTKEKINYLRRIQSEKKEGRNVTSEYLDKKKDSKILIPDDIKGHKEEIKAAKWITDNFGGTIELVKETNRRGIKTPDYIWNGKEWELKNPSSYNAIDQRLRHGIKQIQDNPGGIILDIKNDDLRIEEVRSKIGDRFSRTKSLNKLDVIVRIGENKPQIYRYKK